MRIEGATAVITGGASGLGAGTARRLHKLGANVVIADLQEDKGSAIVAELGSSAAFARADVTNTDQVEAAVDLAVSRFGKVDILVACAGVGELARTVTRHGPMPLNSFKRVVDINLIGTFDFIRLCAWRMINNEPNEEGERGVMVTTASIGAFEGRPALSAYAASKAAVSLMTLPIARDLGNFGIRICSIAPGAFHTAMLVRDGSNAEGLASQAPFPKRLGRPDEYAQLVQQIVENPMLNGETIRLDGALRLSAERTEQRQMCKSFLHNDD